MKYLNLLWDLWVIAIAAAPATDCVVERRKPVPYKKRANRENLVV